MLCSQLVCSGCCKILTYPFGSISCRCRHCSAINAAQNIALVCQGCQVSLIVPINTLRLLCPCCATVTDIPETSLPPVPDPIDLDDREEEENMTIYVSYPPLPVDEEERKQKREAAERRRQKERETRAALLATRQKQYPQESSPKQQQTTTMFGVRNPLLPQEMEEMGRGEERAFPRETDTQEVAMNADRPMFAPPREGLDDDDDDDDEDRYGEDGHDGDDEGEEEPLLSVVRQDGLETQPLMPRQPVVLIGTRIV